MALAFLLMVGCSATQEVAYKPSASPRFRSPEAYEILVTGVWKVIVPESHGSGWVVAKTEKGTYFITCAHVVDMEPYVILEKAYEGEIFRKQVIGAVISVDQKKDIALILVPKNVETPVFKLVPQGDYNRSKKGMAMFSAGYPFSYQLNPIPTFGFAKEFFVDRFGVKGVAHGAGGWYGFSGGPVVDSKGRVYGINALMSHEDPTQIWAVGIQEIYVFLKANEIRV